MGFQANTAQEEAVNTIEGPVMLISCPGSGKTTTLLRRIHHMVETGIPAERILMVTFTRSAAADMQKRYAAMYAGEKSAYFSTIHALCYRILLTDGGWKRENLVVDRDALYHIVNILEETGWVNDPQKMASEVLGEISKVRNNYLNLESYDPESCKPDVFRQIYHGYAEWKRQNHTYDMDDMLIECKKLLENNQQVLIKYQKRFPYIQCDEYQDTNYVQRDILYLLAGDSKNLCIVGDDDQSIYAFRGARPDIMLNFDKDFPECRVIHMNTNYRSAGRIVALADTLIKVNTERFPKQFISFRGQNGTEGTIECVERNGKVEEVSYLTGKIEQLHKKGIPYSDMAVLYRTNDLVNTPATALAAAKIPFRANDKIKSVYDDWIFQTIACYTRLGLGIGTKADAAFVLNRPNRYLSGKRFAAIPYEEESYKHLVKIMFATRPTWAFDAAYKSVREMFAYFGPGKLSNDMPASEIFERLSGKRSLHFEKYLLKYADERKMDPDDLLGQFHALRADAEKCGTISAWLNHAKRAVLVMDSLNKKKDKDGVWLSTMHGAKGLEWKVVFIIDVNKGVVPHKKSADNSLDIEEERRLFYVAMTRAKDNLYILSAKGKRSPFIEEMENGGGKELLRESFTPPIIGATVRHPIYGYGIVTDYNDGHVIAEFAGEEKTFRWPDAVMNGFLEYSDF